MELLGLPYWIWWLAIAVALIVFDLTTMGTQFILVATGLAALVAAGAAALEMDFTAQAWTFVLSTLVLAPLMVYLFRRFAGRRGPGPREPGWERGAEVPVVDQGGRLVAKLKGDHYPVRLSDGSPPVAGETLIVERMEGITLIAHRRNESTPPTKGD